jgi:hypothetical protein
MVDLAGRSAEIYLLDNLENKYMWTKRRCAETAMTVHVAVAATGNHCLQTWRDIVTVYAKAALGGDIRSSTRPFAVVVNPFRNRPQGNGRRHRRRQLAPVTQRTVHRL